MHRVLPAMPARRLGSLLIAATAILVAMPSPAGAWTLARSDASASDTDAGAPRVQVSSTALRTPRRVTLVMPAGLPKRKPFGMGVSRIEGVSPSPSDDLVALDAFARRTGRMPASWSIWNDWGGPDSGFPNRRLLAGLDARGVQPVIFWQPTTPVWPVVDPGQFAYARIAAGDWDGYLTRWARDARAYGNRVIVRWAHEMNAPWMPWAIGRNGNTPRTFRAAWRHIVTVVRGIAPNVRFMWAPNEPCGRCVPLKHLYPGDRWVNVAGFSAYNWSGQARRTMARQYSRAIRAIRAVTHKPLIAAETGIAAPGKGRAQWILKGYPQIYKRFPLLRGAIYFDVDMRRTGHPTWQLSARDRSLAGYRAVIADPRFQGDL